MAGHDQFLKLFLTILLISPAAFTLKCYVCNSGFDEDCKISPPPKKFLIDCANDQSHEHQQKPSSNQTETLPDHDSKEDMHHHQNNDHDNHHHENVTEHRVNRTSRSVEKEDAEPGFFTMEAVKLPKEASYCRKISYHIPAQVNGPESKLPKSVRIVRSCGYITEDKNNDNITDHEEGCKWIGTEGIQLEQCTCFKDECNSAYLNSALTMQTLLLFSVISAGYFYIL